MTGLFADLIVISPGSHHIFKFRLTKTGITVLALSCLISFFIVVMMGSIFTFPPLVTDIQQIREENEQLKVKTMNMSIGVRKVNDRITHLESLSQQITALAGTE